MLNKNLFHRLVAEMSRFVARTAMLHSSDARTFQHFTIAQVNEHGTKIFVVFLGLTLPPDQASVSVNLASTPSSSDSARRTSALSGRM